MTDTVTLLPHPLDLLDEGDRFALKARLMRDPWDGLWTPKNCPTRRHAIQAFFAAARWKGGHYKLAQEMDVREQNTPERLGRPMRWKRQWWWPYKDMVQIPYSYGRVRYCLVGERWAKKRQIRLQFLRNIAEIMDLPMDTVLTHLEWVRQVPKSISTKRSPQANMARSGTLRPQMGRGPHGGIVQVSERRWQR